MVGVESRLPASTGKDMSGGEIHHLTKGDVIVIPAAYSLVRSATSVTYYVVKSSNSKALSSNQENFEIDKAHLKSEIRNLKLGPLVVTLGHLASGQSRRRAAQGSNFRFRIRI